MLTRKHIRWRGYDYTSANAYFITICVKEFLPLFGEVRNGIMGLSEIGNAAAVELQSIPESHPNIVIDEFIVMPNHVHCILDLIWRKQNGETLLNEFSKPVKGSVSIIINHYKGLVKKWCNRNGFESFEWQGRFYDHIIRSPKEYQFIKEYIVNNPAQWHSDRLRP